MISRPKIQAFLGTYQDSCSHQKYVYEAKSEGKSFRFGGVQTHHAGEAVPVDFPTCGHLQKWNFSMPQECLGRYGDKFPGTPQSF